MTLQHNLLYMEPKAISNISELEKTGEKIDISNWENFNSLFRFYIELHGYKSILLFLLNKNIDINSDIYQYYQTKYIQTYINFFYEREDLLEWIANKYNDIQQFEWAINFSRKEVIVTCKKF